MRRHAITFVVATGALCLPAAAFATVHIRAGEAVTDVRVVGDDVRVDGHVRGHVIVIDGGLTIGSRGVVNDATLLGGRVQTEPGATLNGDVFQLGGSWPQPDGWPAVIFLASLLTIRTVILWLMLGSASFIATEPILDRVASAGKARPLRTVSVGVLALLGIGAAMVLLAISLIGLLVAVALAGLLAASGAVGLALALRGSSDMVRARKFSALWLSVPLVGEGLFTLASVIGLGSLLRAAAGIEGSRSAVARQPL